MEELTDKDGLHFDMLENEMEQNLSRALESSVATVVNMPQPILSMMYGDLNGNVLWKLMGLVDKSHKTEDSVTLLCLLTDYISSECSAIGMCDMATDMSSRRGNDPTNFIKQLAILWNNVLIKAKKDLTSSSFNGLVKNLERYTKTFSSHGLDRLFCNTLEMAQHLNKIKSGDNDLDPRDFDLPVDMNISLPPSSCIPHRTMVKMMYVDTSRYCPLYDKKFRGMSAKQIKKEVKKIRKYGLDNKSWFPAVNIEQKGNDIEPCISVEQNSKINQGSSDSTMKQANYSNKMANCNPGLTEEKMERSVNKDMNVNKNKTKETLYMYPGSCQTEIDRRDNQEMKTIATNTDAKNGKMSSADYLKTKILVTNTGVEYGKMLSADGDAQRRNKNAFKVESAKRNEHIHGNHNVFDCTEPCMMEKKQDSKMAELHNKDLTVQSSKVLKTKKENKYLDRYLVESSKSNVQQQNSTRSESHSGKQKDMCMNKGHKHIDEQNQTKTPSSSVCLPKFSKNIDKKLQTLSEEKCKKKNKDGHLVLSPKMDTSADKTNFDLMVKKLDKLEYAIFNLMETIDEDSGLESEAYRNLQKKYRGTGKLVEKDVNVCDIESGKNGSGKSVSSASSSLKNVYHENSVMNVGVMTGRGDENSVMNVGVMTGRGDENSERLGLNGKIDKKKSFKEKDIRCYFSTPSPSPKKRKITAGEDNSSPAKLSRYQLPFSSRF